MLVGKTAECKTYFSAISGREMGESCQGVNFVCLLMCSFRLGNLFYGRTWTAVHVCALVYAHVHVLCAHCARACVHTGHCTNLHRRLAAALEEQGVSNNIQSRQWDLFH